MAIIYIVSDLGNFSLDVTSSIDFNLNNEITEYAVESGFSITKGVVTKSDSYSITGIISDYHLKNPSDFRSDEIFENIRKIKESRNTVSLVAKSLNVPNLVIESVTANESVGGGFAKSVTISLKQIRASTSKTTTVPREAKKTINGDVGDLSEETANKGTQPKNKVEDDRSWASQLHDLFKFFWDEPTTDGDTTNGN